MNEWSTLATSYPSDAFAPLLDVYTDYESIRLAAEAEEDDLDSFMPGGSAAAAAPAAQPAFEE